MARRLLTLTLLVVGGALLLVGCGDSAGPVTQGSDTTAAPTAGILFPPAPAPELGLRDHLGRRVTTEEFRGKAMFVTFVYAGCPDVCPLIVSNLRRTLDRLGPRAKDVQMIAVSVDPAGDTPARITTYLRSQKMTGRMLWLVGSRADLESAWMRWGIDTRIPRENPDLVEHAAPIYGVNAQGVISTIYDSSFTPKDLLRDIPGLLGT